MTTTHHATDLVPLDAIATTCDARATEGFYLLTTTATGCPVSEQDQRPSYVLVFAKERAA